jgi:aspartyl-tRNA(Asn)/glutamyl-tRNA(Gln) amidotransferase subunit A
MPYVRTNIENGRGVTSADYAKALAQLEQYRAYVRDFFTRYDLLITPTLALPAFPVGQRPKTIAGHAVDERMGFYPFTFPFNMAGNPAASIPCGFSKEGLPIGLHLVGRRYEEVTVFQAAAAFEEARPWANKRPSVS